MGKRATLLVVDSPLFPEVILDNLSHLVKNGEVPGLYLGEDRNMMLEQLAPLLSDATGGGNPDSADGLKASQPDPLSSPRKTPKAAALSPHKTSPRPTSKQQHRPSTSSTAATEAEDSLTLEDLALHKDKDVEGDLESRGWTGLETEEMSEDIVARNSVNPLKLEELFVQRCRQNLRVVLCCAASEGTRTRLVQKTSQCAQYD